MNIVKISRNPNGTSGQLVTTVSVPINMARELPEGCTHMTVERFDGGILYRPFAVVNSPKMEKLIEEMG